MMKLCATGLCAALSLVAWHGAARACGTWTLRDAPLGHEVHFYAASVRLQRPGQPRQTILRLSGMPGEFEAIQGDWAPGKKPSVKMRHPDIFLRGKKVATFADGTLQLNGKQYRLAIGPAREKRAGLDHFVSVVFAGKQVLSGAAMSFLIHCGDEEYQQTLKQQPLTVQQDKQREEIRQRVAFYLVWREFMRR